MILIWLTFCNVFAARALSYEQLSIHTAIVFASLCMQARTQQVGETARAWITKDFLESWSHNYLASDHIVIGQKQVWLWVNGNYVDNAWESFTSRITGWPGGPLSKQHRTAEFAHLTREPGLPGSEPFVRNPTSHVVTCFFSSTRLLLIKVFETPKVFKTPKNTTLVKIGISLIGETFSRWRC